MILTSIIAPMINACVECIRGFLFSFRNGESSQCCYEGLVPKIFNFHMDGVDEGGLLL